VLLVLSPDMFAVELTCEYVLLVSSGWVSTGRRSSGGWGVIVLLSIWLFLCVSDVSL